MTPPGDIRASDADRQRVADALSQYAGEGRLTLDELSERLEETYTARTVRQLNADQGPLRELPPLFPALGPPLPAAQPVSSAGGRHPVVWLWFLVALIIGLAVGGARWGGTRALWTLLLVAFVARRILGRHRQRHRPDDRR